MLPPANSTLADGRSSRFPLRAGNVGRQGQLAFSESGRQVRATSSPAQSSEPDPKQSAPSSSWWPESRRSNLDVEPLRCRPEWLARTCCVKPRFSSASCRLALSQPSAGHGLGWDGKQGLQHKVINAGEPRKNRLDHS